MTFDPSQFTATKWSTAQDKAAFANRFVRLVQSDFADKHFTEKFYQRLSNASAILLISTGADSGIPSSPRPPTRCGLKLTVQYPCYGDPAWTFSDVEQAVQRGSRPRERWSSTSNDWPTKSRPGSVLCWPGFKRSTGKRPSPRDTERNDNESR